MLMKHAKTTKVRQNRQPIASPLALFQCDQSFQMQLNGLRIKFKHIWPVLLLSGFQKSLC